MAIAYNLFFRLIKREEEIDQDWDGGGIVTLPLRGVIHYICISCENEIDEDRSVIGECVLIYLGRWRGVLR